MILESDMAANALENMMSRLRSLASLQQAGQLQDRELLERFIQQHDEAAFTAIVERHAGMVLQVCRGVLRHHQDAEDACQATFLVLVRKASSIRKLHSLASWLHGVAFRIALKLRGKIARSHRLQEDLQKNRPADETRFTVGELNGLVDEELERLPEKYRAPLILCYLQAKTRDEAAQALGIEPSTLKGRLEWGRKLLRQRLIRRGVAMSLAMLFAGIGQSAYAAVPASLAVTIVKSSLAAESAVAGGLASTQAVLLAQAFLRAAFVKQLQVAAAMLLMTISMAGTGWLVYQAMDSGRTNPDGVKAAATPRPDENAQPEILSPEDAPLASVKNPATLPDDTAPHARGQQLAAKCAECHTPRNGKGEQDSLRFLQGRRESPRSKSGEREHEAPDLTASGIGGRWSEERLVRFLVKGTDDRGLEIAHKLAGADAQAVAAYLRTVPGKKKGEGRRGD